MRGDHRRFLDGDPDRVGGRLSLCVGDGQRQGVVSVVVIVGRRPVRGRVAVVEVPVIRVDAVIVARPIGRERHRLVLVDRDVFTGVRGRGLIPRDRDRALVAESDRRIVRHPAVFYDVAVDFRIVDRVVVPLAPGPEVAVVLAAPPVVWLGAVPAVVGRPDRVTAAGSRSTVRFGWLTVSRGRLCEEVTAITIVFEAFGSGHPPPGTLARVIAGPHPAGAAEFLPDVLVLGVTSDRDQIPLETEVIQRTRRISGRRPRLRLVDVLVVVARPLEVERVIAEVERDRAVVRGGLPSGRFEGDRSEDRLIFRCIRRSAQREDAALRAVRARVLVRVDTITAGKRRVITETIAGPEPLIDTDLRTVDRLVVGNRDIPIDDDWIAQFDELCRSVRGVDLRRGFDSHRHRVVGGVVAHVADR